MIYNPDECAVFFRVKEQHGALSNMAGGFPLVVNGVHIRTSEALYQALRFPDHPDIQQKIIDEKSPMSAKMVAKAHIAKTRDRWDLLREMFMGYCILLKLLQNRETFGKVLVGTGSKQIVEKSRKDPFWGAVPREDGLLEGQNVLGNFLTKLRDKYKAMPDYAGPLVFPYQEDGRGTFLGEHIAPVKL
jgi:ribA/ribD-fused uncharacterized protein